MPPQDEQILLLDVEGRGVVPSAWGKKGVISGAPHACVGTGAFCVALGVDGEHFSEAADPGLVVVRIDVISDADGAHRNDTTVAGFNGGIE